MRQLSPKMSVFRQISFKDFSSSPFGVTTILVIKDFLGPAALATPMLRKSMSNISYCY